MAVWAQTTTTTTTPSPIAVTVVSPEGFASGTTTTSLNLAACGRNDPAADAFRVSVNTATMQNAVQSGALTAFMDASASCTNTVASTEQRFVETYTQTQINNSGGLLQSPNKDTTVTLAELMNKVSACPGPSGSAIQATSMKYCLQYNPVPGNQITNTNLIGFLWLLVDTKPPVAVTGLSVTGGDGRINVAWNNVDTDLASFNIIYTPAGGASSVVNKVGGNLTSYVLEGVENGVEYSVQVQAIDNAGNEGDVSEAATATGEATCNFWNCYKGQEKGGFCFVSTAAYGSYDAPFVQVFRDFRDRILMKSGVGRAFILWYYQNGLSPAIWLAEHQFARIAAAAMLTIPYMAAWPFVRLTPVALLVWSIGSLLAGLFVAWMLVSGRSLSRRGGSQRSLSQKTRGVVTMILALALAAQAHAADDVPVGEAPAADDFGAQHMEEASNTFDDIVEPARFELGVKLGPYRPNVDKAGDSNDFYALFFGDNQPKRNDLFGPGSRLRVDVSADYYFLRKFGKLGVNGSVGFFQALGRARKCDSGCDNAALQTADLSGDGTMFTIVPLAISLVYKLDIFWRWWKIPLVPTVRAGFDYYIWRVDGSGRQARTADAGPYGFSLKGNGWAQGATYGWHVNPGLAISLDWIEPSTARRANTLMGMRGSYLTFEWVFNGVNDFGSSSSWDLSFSTFQAGLALEF